MDRRKKNNILIGVLCCALVFMGIGYAVLNVTLSIGATANITGNFDIHFSSIQRSATSIQDSDLLSTMASGTGITNSPTNTEGEFTAVLQKPGDYVIYDVVVVNTGSIDGYLTFSFGDTNNNFDYYDDFYKVEFIRDDTEPDIIADILQNQTFTDSQVLVKTNGTRTYKIKVTYKSTAESFPDAETYDDFECTMSLTYSQQAPGGNSGSGSSSSGSGEQENSLTWYYGSVESDNEYNYAMAIDSNYNLAYFIAVPIESGSESHVYVDPSLGAELEAYDSNETYSADLMSLNPQEGDYCSDAVGAVILRGNDVYFGDSNHLGHLTLDSTGSLAKYGVS